MSKLKQAIDKKDWITAKRLIMDNPKYLEENVNLVLGMIKELDDLVPIWRKDDFFDLCANFTNAPEDEVLPLFRKATLDSLKKAFPPPSQWVMGLDTFEKMKESIIGDPDDKNGPPNPICSEKHKSNTCFKNHPIFNWNPDPQRVFKSEDLDYARNYLMSQHKPGRYEQQCMGVWENHPEDSIIEENWETAKKNMIGRMRKENPGFEKRIIGGYALKKGEMLDEFTKLADDAEIDISNLGRWAAPTQQKASTWHNKELAHEQAIRTNNYLKSQGTVTQSELIKSIRENGVGFWYPDKSYVIKNVNDDIPEDKHVYLGIDLDTTIGDKAESISEKVDKRQREMFTGKPKFKITNPWEDSEKPGIYSRTESIVAESKNGPELEIKTYKSFDEFYKAMAVQDNSKNQKETDGNIIEKVYLYLTRNGNFDLNSWVTDDEITGVYFSNHFFHFKMLYDSILKITEDRCEVSVEINKGLPSHIGEFAYKIKITKNGP